MTTSPLMACARRRDRVRRTRRLALGALASVTLAAAAPAAVAVAARGALAAPKAVAAVTVSPSPAPAFPGDAPDPDVVLAGSTYFAFTTGTALGNHIQALVSSSPASGYHSYTGQPYGSTALANTPGWETPNTQTSPGVFYWGGHWLMYYDAAQAPAASDTGHDCISIAVGGTTLSPSSPQFTDGSSGGMICQAAGSIDPSPFVDPATGNAYLIWKQNDGGSSAPATIWAQQLSPDGFSLVGPASKILFNDTVDYPWETTVENPDMVYDAGTYYLLFSAGVYTSSGYSEGIATCASPLGPCGTNTQILTTYGSALGPGGGSLFADPSGNWWLDYAAWQGGSGGCTSYGCGGARDLFVAPIGLPSASPQIAGVSPDRGSTAGGTTLTITGTNLDDAAAVDVGPRAATIDSDSPSAIVATTPAGSAGAVAVSVSTTYGTGTDPAAFTYFSPAPTIASLSPSSGSVAGLTSVTITGTNLAGTTSVTFGTSPATVTSDNPTSVTVVTPPGPAGPVDVVVTTSGGSAAASGGFTYVVPPAPTITSISPAEGPEAGQTLVTVRGTNLQSVTGATFGSGTASVYSDPDAGSTVVLVSPAGTAGAPVDVGVTTAGGSATDPGAFTYLGPVANPYTPLAPERICDTRAGNPSGLTGTAAQCNGGGAGEPLAPGEPLSIAVAPAFVPADASAVVLNVTAVSSTTSGYVTVYPTDQVPPTASTLNYSPGRGVPNLVESAVGAGGEVSIVSNSAVDVVVDLAGYAGPQGSAGAGLYNALSTPARICDTRSGNPSGLSPPATQCDSRRLAAGTPLPVTVTGLGGVPRAGVAAVVLNVTAVGPAQRGYLTAYPTGEPAPTASNLNFLAGQTVANRVIVPVGTGGTVSLVANQPVDAVVDVSGWFSAAGGSGTQFTPLAAPIRECDTRPGNPSGLSGAQAQCNGSGGSGETLQAGRTLTVQVGGLAGIPSGVSAVVLNLTAVHPRTQTYLTVYPASPLPTVSDLNPAAGVVQANLVVATVTAGGDVSIYNHSGSVDVVVDVAGWYS